MSRLYNDVILSQFGLPSLPLPNDKFMSLLLSQLFDGGGPSGTLTTVSGEPPLTLADALAKRMHSLVQFGKCAQASTPVPSDPVDIYCNNGALKMVDDELPAGYKRITGITFDGDTWYETGEALTGDDDVSMTLDNTVSRGQNVFGSYNGTSSGAKNFSLFIYGGGSTSNCYFRYGDQLLRPRFGSGERTITFGKSGTSGFQTDVSVEPDTFTTPGNAYIGMLPNSTSSAYVGDIKGSICVGTRLKWVPCERVSDGAIGYYETCEGAFIAPSGTGTPISLGYDGSHYILSVVGTPEVLTVEHDLVDHTASVVGLYAVGSYADTQEIISGRVVRKCAVKVLNGTEDWTTTGTSSVSRAPHVVDGVVTSGSVSCISTHFAGTTRNTSSSDMPDNSIRAGYGTGAQKGDLYIKSTTYSTGDSVAAFLAAQYAAGTPLIVIYPIAEDVMEHTAAQAIMLSSGTSTVSLTAEVDGIELEAQYYKS